MEFLDSLWKYLIVSSPYLLLGLLISGFIHQFINVDRIKKWLGKDNLSTVIKAALVGVPLPLCSCSVIPTAVTLRKSGASKSATSSFLISTPESGVDSISITYALMDLPMTIIRPLSAFLSAFVAGTLQIFFNKEVVNIEQAQTSSCCSKSKPKVSDKSFKQRFVAAFQYGYGTLLNDIALWLVIGLIAGGLIDWIVPNDFFENLTGAQSRFAILLVGIPLYICATASTPIAVSLILKGMSPGAALVLLLVGPATNVSNIAVLSQYIGKKAVILNIISIVVVALGMSYLVDYLYAHHFQFSYNQKLHSHEHSAWWEILSAIILVLLLFKGVYVEEIRPRFKKEEAHCH